MENVFPEGDPILAQGIKIPGCGSCIYCGSDGGRHGLRDEHVIPFCLGGRAVLLAASCAACEAATCKLDGYLANRVFRQLRIFMQLPSRRKTTTKIKSLPIAFEWNGERRTVDLALEHCPSSVRLPMFHRPTLVEGGPPMEDYRYSEMITLGNIPPTFREAVGLPEEGVCTIFPDEVPLDLRKFGRALAKIGYCTAIMKWGHGVINPLDVTAMILGKYPYGHHYVGGLPNVRRPRTEGRWHEVAPGVSSVGMRRFALARIRLFSMVGPDPGAGTPFYDVIAGEFPRGFVG